MTEDDKFNLPEEPENEDLDEGPVEPRNLEEREVHVVGVFEHSDQNTAITNPFVLIRDNNHRCVLIWVGKFEAFAISMALEGASAERPLTHDLLKNLTERLGARLDRIVIDDLWGETFYAKLWLSANGKPVMVDSRPSDAIALALRVKCPVYMTEAVLQEVGRPCEEFEGGPSEDEEQSE